MCEGASKQSPDLKNYTALGLRPRFLNSWICHYIYMNAHTCMLVKIYTFKCGTNNQLHILTLYFYVLIGPLASYPLARIQRVWSIEGYKGKGSSKLIPGSHPYTLKLIITIISISHVSYLYICFRSKWNSGWWGLEREEGGSRKYWWDSKFKAWVTSLIWRELDCKDRMLSFRV